MAITNKEKGVWDVDQVYNKINEGGIWDYDGAAQLFAWGQNYTGVNMQNNTITRSSPTQVGTVNTWDKDNVTMSKNFFNAIKTDGTAWTGGNNNYGVLGQNKSPGFGAGQQYAVSSPVQLPGSWSRFEQGNESMWGVKTDGTAWSWGLNNYGNLGQNQEPSSLGSASSPTQIGTDTTWDQVGQMGNKSGFGVKTNGTMWVWGDNTLGGLGLNAPANAHKSSPTQLGTETTWTTNASGPFGGFCGAGIKTDGTLWTWGLNSSGQLGHNKSYAGSTPAYGGLSSPTQVGTDTTWSQVKGMGNGMIALKTDNTLWAWGSNSYGALGQNTQGDNRSSPVQIPAGPGTWSSFSASYKAGAAIKTDGTLWTWGNDDGGMGGRNTNNPGGGRVSSPTQIPGTDWSSIHGGRASRNFMATQSI